MNFWKMELLEIWLQAGWRDRNGKEIFCQGRQSIGSNIKRNCMVNITCIVSGLGTGKIISSAVRTGRKSVLGFCKGRNPIGGRREI